MTIHFNIEYRTLFGEQLVLNIQKEDEELRFPDDHSQWREMVV